MHLLLGKSILCIVTLEAELSAEAVAGNPGRILITLCFAGKIGPLIDHRIHYDSASLCISKNCTKRVAKGQFSPIQKTNDNIRQLQFGISVYLVSYFVTTLYYSS